VGNQEKIEKVEQKNMGLGNHKGFYTRFGLILAGWLLAGLLATPAATFAQQSGTSREYLIGNPNNLPLATGETLQDLRLSGLYDRRDIAISVPTNWALRDGSLIEVKMNHSPLLLPETSNLTVLVNDQPVNSIKLDRTNQSNFTWNIPIPSNLQPQNGRLVVSFLARMRINDLLCPPVDDKASWLNIGATSRVVLAYNETAPASLSDFSQIFFASTNTLDRKVNIVVPPNPTSRDLSRATHLMGRMGALAGIDGADMSLSYGTPTASGNQILLGGQEIFGLLRDLNLPMPVDGNSFSDNGQKIADGAGVLQFARPATRTGTTLVVSGSNADGVDRAVEALLDDRSLNLLRGTATVIQPGSTFVPPDPNARPRATALNGRTSFRQMGFENRIVTGYGIQDSYYSFTIPAYTTVTGNAQLALDYNFSGVLDARRSSVSVILNDTLLEGVSLGTNYTNKDPNGSQATQPPNGGANAAAPGTTPGTGGNTQRLNVNVPKELLRNGDNRLTVRFALYISAGQPCGEISTYNDLWGVVYDSTEITLQTTPTTARTPSLNLLPYPFAGSQNAGTLLLMSNTPDVAETRLAAQLAAELGRNDIPGQFKRINIMAAGEAKPDDLAKNNVILIGKPDNNTLLKEVNTKLPVVWDSNTARTLSTERGLKLGSSDNALAALVQVTASPWSEAHSLLTVINEPNRTDNGRHLVNAIGKNVYIGKYRGNVMIVDSLGKSYTFNSFDKNEQALSTSAPAPATTIAAGNQSAPVTTAAVVGSTGTPTAVAGGTDATVTASATAPKPATTSSGGGTSTLLGLGILGLAVLGVAGIGAFFFLRQRRSRK
jgi:hypothetical protein